MALFRKFFYKKPPDGLLEITERVYVFDYCFTADVMEENELKVYIGGIVRQLHDHFHDASFMVFNMREGENQSQISNILSDYDMTVMDYPRQYEGCPLLTMEMIHHFLRSGESWLQLGQQNVVLMHCERGGWPVLAFMLAALLIYRKQFTGEQKTLDMIYKQAPRELLQLMSPLNPLPSQLRYLQYISRRNVGSEWPPLDRALTLDCVIIRHIPKMDGEGGCRPIFRIYGPDPFMAADRTPKVLFSTPKRSKLVRYYKQADCELVKIDINCHVQGDVVLECISLDSDLEREHMMFRVMFNTAFIRSNILMLNRDEIDILWNAKDNFPKDFRVEVLFSDMEASSSVISIDLPRIEDKEGLPVEAFAKVKEMFYNVDWLDSNTEVANVLQQITASNILLERLDSGVSSPTGNLLKESLSGRFKFDSKTQNDMKSSKLSISSFGSSEDAPTEKKIELLESKALPENNIKTLEPMDQGEQAIPSAGLSTDSNSTKMQIEALESKASLNVTKFPISVAQGKKPTPLIKPSIDANSLKKKVELLESKQKEIESLDLKALLENDRRFKFEPKALPEIDIKSPSSAVHGKLSLSSSEDAPMEKKIETLESKALPENNMKTLASVDQGKQPILSSDLSTHPNSTKMQIEPFQSEALLENVTKFPASVAQEKKSTPLIEPSMDANLVKRKIGPLESIEMDSESLELKTLLQNDDNCPKSMAQEKQSIPLIEPSMDANSMKKEIGQLESKVLSENDMKSLTSTVQGKQDGPLLELPIDGNSIKKMIEPQKLQVAIQLPAQSKIISPRVRQAVRSAPVSYSNSLQGSPVGMSRYHSAPSALGLTTVLQDRAPMDIKEVTEEMTVSPPSSTSPPSDSKVPKSVEPSSASVPPASSPALLPYSASTSSVDALSSIVKTSGPLVSASPPPPPSLPPPPPQCVPTSKLMQPTVTKHPETTMHDKGKKSSVTPPPPPPPPLPVQDIKSSLSIPASSTAELSTPSYAAKSTSISHLPSSSLPGTSLSTVKDAFKGPPPPSSPPLPPPSSIPSPPPLSGLPSSAAYPLSSPSKSPPPPPPPPGHSGTTPAPILTSSVPPPPPPPASASKTPPPPPPPASASKTPPPPPPPASPSKISLSNNSVVPVPPVPPPPSPSANGLSKSDTAPLQSPVPPIPGPPSGVPFGAKGRGLFRANPKGQSQTKRSNLKPYHWLKLTRAVHGSLWAETQKFDEASKAPEFDMSELETLFSAAAPNSDGKGGKSNRRTSRQKVDKVQLIELRRAYNCEIMLTKVKIPLPDLMSAVLALDDSVLYVDQVENLIKFCPTKEEMELLKNYTGDKDNLGKCEQFFLELMKVPRVENKLRVFSFKMQFCTQVAELRRDLNIVNSASEEIRNSIKLKRIMQTILSLGNALNHGTARGSAIGFRLDSLLKLTDTRARNNKMTLMHYLCKVLAEKLPELLDFPKDLVNLEGSTKIQLKYLAEEMQAISKGLEKVVQELTASENDGPVSESFCQTLKEFLGVAEAEVRSLALLYANVGRNADALALYFGEDPARVPFEQVVSTLQNFVKMFIRAHDENCKQLEYEKKRAEKEAEKLAPKKDSEHMIRTTIKSGNSK